MTYKVQGHQARWGVSFRFSYQIDVLESGIRTSQQMINARDTEVVSLTHVQGSPPS